MIRKLCGLAAALSLSVFIAVPTAASAATDPPVAQASASATKLGFKGVSVTKKVGFAKRATIKGSVTVPTGVSPAEVAVTVQRKIAGTGWNTVKKLTPPPAGRFSTRLVVRAGAKVRLVAKVAGQRAVTSKSRSVKLTTGTSSQRAVYAAALKDCAKSPGDAKDPSAMWVDGGPRAVTVVGKYASLNARCLLPGEGNSGALTFWHKPNGAWKLYLGTQNSLACEDFDAKGWPAKLTGDRCYDQKTGEERAITR
jgi:hypothetical protein